MSLSRTLLRQLRPASSSSRVVLRSFSSSRPTFSETPASDAPVNPKIAPIVDSISSLSLLEVSELVTALKTKLNITEIALPAASAPASSSASSSSAEAPAEEKPKEKTIFTVKLEKFDAAAKAKIIREVKALMPNMNLVEVSHRFRAQMDDT
ncbi:50S small subunit ribosomal protein L7/L12 [Cryptococcus bacillisporus CA1873]|uniref:50S small subunit ribosomal protein L7/L12 n=1 Tax=Cryptococcus bacillisporus CA1873 TaxID=1296111 RepID=A0ABR5BC78_CRYGA|nr:50S small subunit ribosomal protein L7/L12 [Cryptococcus bacillisporus CA1873]|eukprot:KIR63869.1 50S small subunit ribosomal protein L7/L12 [Cryptococcus gattii CA1873]